MDYLEYAHTLGQTLIETAKNEEPRKCFSEKIDLMLVGIGTLLKLQAMEAAKK